MTADTPPHLLYHGTLDSVVPLDHAKDYRTALNANGVDNELLLLRGQGHVAAFLFGGAAEDAGAAFLARTLTAAH